MLVQIVHDDLASLGVPKAHNRLAMIGNLTKNAAKQPTALLDQVVG